MLIKHIVLALRIPYLPFIELFESSCVWLHGIWILLVLRSGIFKLDEILGNIGNLRCLSNLKYISLLIV